MPHQCLKCGNVFPTGSTEILTGCNQCGGKRFFYTAQALSPDERKVLVKQANQDIRELVRELLTKQDALGKGGREEVRHAGEEWVKVKPKEAKPEEVKPEKVGKGIEELVEEVKEDKRGEVPRVEEKAEEEEVKPTPHVERKRRRILARKEVRKEVKAEKKLYPEVINVIEAGVYEIDLMRLLEDSPIIVHKDGTYLIHLPSLFKGQVKMLRTR